jgi:hypothetical protein
MSDDRELNAVLAHSMLGTVAAIKGAVQTVLSLELDGGTRDGLLLMAVRRLDYLAEQVRDLALGLPDEVVEFLDELRQDHHLEPAIAD